MPSILESKELTQEVAGLRMAEMRNIVSSQTFAKAPRLCSFLSYIVEKSVEGDVDSLTEQQIGIHVFNRPPGYNSNDDNIVRGTARSLRQRLATYYLTEGAQNFLQIDIPKGAYVAHFVEHGLSQEFPAVALFDEAHSLGYRQPEIVEHGGIRGQRGLWLAWTLVVLFAGLAAWPAIHTRYMRTHDKSHVLWDTLFTNDRQTLIVPGDAGLNMYEWLSNKTVDLNEYSQQNLRANQADSTTIADLLGGRFYTTISDLQLVSKLVRLPEADPDHVQVRFARDLSASDLKDANLILIGTRSYNPWTELFQSHLTLRMSWDVNNDLFTVQNVTPQAGEKSSYQWTVKNGTQGGLTLISLTDNSQGNGRVLLIEGTTMAGVFAGSDFLYNKQLLNPILAKAQRPDGTLRNFDVLLKSDFIREGVSNLQVLVEHVH
jgi:hypothetical protein